MAANPLLPVTYVNRLASETGLDGILIVTPAFFAEDDHATAFVADLISKGALVIPDSSSFASIAYVDGRFTTLLGGVGAALDTLNEFAAAINNDASYASTITSALAAKAPLASPTFTGVPAGPTAAANTNTTQLATTAHVYAVKQGTMGTVNHGSTAGTARPSGYAAITWIGSVDPSNKITGDIWIDTTA